MVRALGGPRVDPKTGTRHLADRGSKASRTATGVRRVPDHRKTLANRRRRVWFTSLMDQSRWPAENPEQQHARRTGPSRPTTRRPASGRAAPGGGSTTSKSAPTARPRDPRSPKYCEESASGGGIKLRGLARRRALAGAAAGRRRVVVGRAASPRTDPMSEIDISVFGNASHQRPPSRGLARSEDIQIRRAGDPAGPCAVPCQPCRRARMGRAMAPRLRPDSPVGCSRLAWIQLQPAPLPRLSGRTVLAGESQLGNDQWCWNMVAAEMVGRQGRSHRLGRPIPEMWSTGGNRPDQHTMRGW